MGCLSVEQSSWLHVLYSFSQRWIRQKKAQSIFNIAGDKFWADNGVIRPLFLTPVLFNINKQEELAEGRKKSYKELGQSRNKMVFAKLTNMHA